MTISVSRSRSSARSVCCLKPSVSTSLTKASANTALRMPPTKAPRRRADDGADGAAGRAQGGADLGSGREPGHAEADGRDGALAGPPLHPIQHPAVVERVGDVERLLVRAVPFHRPPVGAGEAHAGVETHLGALRRELAGLDARPREVVDIDVAVLVHHGEVEERGLAPVPHRDVGRALILVGSKRQRARGHG